MASDFIIDATEGNFEYEVLNYSQNLPVVVDFWAPWCVPCKALGQDLGKLAEEGQGRFRLARVNVDDNPRLAQRYGVRSIPAVKVFRQGQVAAEFVGTIPEPHLRELIARIAPDPNDLLVAKAESLIAAHEWSAAGEIFREYLLHNPGHPAALLGLARSLLGAGEGEAAAAILDGFPVSREYNAAQGLLPLARSLSELEQDRLDDETPLDAAFHNSLRLAARGNLLAALDGLMDILRQNRRYRDGLAHQAILGLLDLLGEEDPDARTYRNELASILF